MGPQTSAHLKGFTHTAFCTWFCSSIPDHDHDKGLLLIDVLGWKPTSPCYTMHNLLTYRSRLRSQTAYIILCIQICEVNRVNSIAAAANDCVQSKLPLILHHRLHSCFTAALTLHSCNITQLVKIYCVRSKLAQTCPAMYHIPPVLFSSTCLTRCNCQWSSP